MVVIIYGPVQMVVIVQGLRQRSSHFGAKSKVLGQGRLFRDLAKVVIIQGSRHRSSLFRDHGKNRHFSGTRAKVVIIPSLRQKSSLFRYLG